MSEREREISLLYPCSAKLMIVCLTNSSYCWITCFDCFLSVSLTGAPGMAFQSNRRSILLSATMNGVLRWRRSCSDSIVCGSMPCIISTTKMAISH